MQLHRHFAWVAAAALGLASVGSGLASENKIAVAPGGPHPYFAPWEQAAADAKKDFGIAAVDYKVPSDWKPSSSRSCSIAWRPRATRGSAFFPATRSASIRP